LLLEKGVMFKKNSNYKDVIIYIDSEYIDDRISTFGYFTSVGGKIVT